LSYLVPVLVSCDWLLTRQVLWLLTRQWFNHHNGGFEMQSCSPLAAACCWYCLLVVHLLVRVDTLFLHAALLRLPCNTENSLYFIIVKCALNE
jgi:hypothetical protein